MKNEAPAPEGAGNFEESSEARPEKDAKQAGAAQAARGRISPPPEHGVHSWMMKAAWAGKKAGLSAEETSAAMCAHEKGARRPFQPCEVEDAVEKVFSTKVARRKQKSREPKVAYNPEKAQRIYEATRIGLDVLRAASPVQEPWNLSPSDVLLKLFADDNILVCAGRTNWDFATATLAEHGDLSGCQFVVPGPMSAREGWTKDKPPKLSAHTKDNTGPREYLVFDFDDPPLEWQPGLILHLTQFRPPALILRSGGKSLHAWHPVFRSRDRNEKFARLAVGLGADPIPVRNRSQFVRMPNGTRDTGIKQEVVFLNPGPWRDDG